MSEPPAVRPMIPSLFAIRRVVRETDDTFTLELRAVDSGNEIVFQPGQFNMVYVHGAGEIPISISGNPASLDTLVHTTRAVGSVTKVMDRLRRGDIVGVRGPYGVPWPVDEARGMDVVLVAGGIGLAPIRPVIYALLARREMYGKVVLLYGTRGPDDILFRNELEEWRSRFDFDVYLTVDRAAGEWKGNVGVVPTLIAKAPFDPSNTVAMICGPEIMMRFTTMELAKRGVARDSMYVSMERSMKCGIGLCGHCQFGPTFVCKDGPVFAYTRVKHLLGIWEI
ncbi:MAG: FAD/NAD(P)-binding protein [Bacteroidota bacterium]